MERKRIGAIVALAMVATVSPLVYQYVIQPRTEASDVSITINDVEYNDAMSTNESTAFNLYLTLRNSRDNDVILSPLQLDVYYHDIEATEERYRLIGEFQTFIDFTIPADDFIGSEINELGLSDRIDVNDDKGFNSGNEITGLLKIYDTEGFKEGSNEALVRLINKGSVTLKFKGNAQFGPISMPFETGAIDLSLTVWDPELVIHDVFLYTRSPTTYTDTFVIHTKMRNPSGIPITLENFTLGLYMGIDTPGDPIISSDRVGWAINSQDILGSNDPDETGKTLSNVFTNNKIIYEFGTEKFLWKDVFFAFNLTNPANPSSNNNKEWFVSTLLDKPIIEDVTLKGSAVIYLGQRGPKGFKIDMTKPEDYLSLTNVNFYQKYLPYYGQTTPFTGKQPITMFGNFTVGQLSTNKMIVDTNPDNPTMTLDIDATTTLRNPYRFSYEVEDFQASYQPVGASLPFAWSESNTSATIDRATRFYNSSYNPLYDPPYPLWTLDMVESVTEIPLNLTTTYQTNDTNAGIYKVFTDLGADIRLLNLTNPFYLPPGSAEYYHNPLSTIEFLVDEGVNPLLLLNETDLFVKVQDYQPLRAQYFDDPYNGRAMADVYIQASAAIGTDMPYLSDPLWGGTTSDFLYDLTKLYNIYPTGTFSNWDDYYDDGTQEGRLRRDNKYDMAVMPTDTFFSDGYFPDDEDITAGGENGGLVRGIILDAPQGTDRTGVFDSTTNSPYSDLAWRVYQYGSYASDRWGPAYDYFNSGTKGYFMGMALDSGNRAMFSQNFTIDPTKFVKGVEDVEQVTLSISYRYFDDVDEYTGGDSAYLMFDWWDVAGDEYEYSAFGSDTAYDNRRGWALERTTDTEWNHKTIDLTNDFKTRLQDIIDHPGDNEYLKGEVSFAGVGDGDTLRVHFDDIVLNVKYKDYTNTMGLNLQDLFKYLEETEADPGTGNLFDLFYELSEDAFIDGMDFWEFLGNDAAPLRPEGDTDIFQYFQNEDVSLSTITKILDEQYTDLGVGEPANFLEMLTKSKYRTVDPGALETWTHDTALGPRLLDDPYWTIEDPYKASQLIMDKLYENIFREDYLVTNGDFVGEELWVMLENLGVTMPWVVMYLLTKGWTKDDIFDTLQALGLASETKVNYDNDRDQGELTATVDVHLNIYGGLVSVDMNDLLMVFDMDPILDDGTQEVFSSMCAAGTGSWQRSIVDNSGTFSNPTPFTSSGTFPVTILWITINVPYEITITPDSFGLRIYINPDPTASIQYPHNINYDDYLILGAGTGNGLNDAGTRQLASNLRSNFKFAGETFMTMGGDPVSFFQFLDTYYFGDAYGVDYSSFTVLNYFDVSGRDFVDIITGYNTITQKFDGNGNGRADDWVAPTSYGVGQRNSLQGWGTNFRDNRLFWTNGGTQYPITGQEDGKIIWSDSPDFADLDWSGHSDGDIRIGGLPNGDRINESAPPIVDLLDMLAWISKSSGTPKPSDLFEWLLSELPDNDYRIVRPEGGGLINPATYNKGLNNQKAWQMLRDGTFNATGFFSWLENEKAINSFKFMYLLNQSTPAVINPADLLFFATSPHMVRFWDGALAFYYHDALDSQSTADANNVLWTFFDSDSFDPEGFFTLLNNSYFDIFEMFMNLQVDPASWLNNLNAKGLEPIEVIAQMLKLDPGQRYLDLTPDTTSNFNVLANLTVKYSGITLKHLTDQHIADNIVLTANYHFADFIVASRLTLDNFVIM